MANSHNLTSLFLPIQPIWKEHAFFSWQVEGTNRIVERLRVGIFACFVVVVLVWGFVWLVCCCCLVFCFFFGWFIRQAHLSGPCYVRWPQPLIPVSWVHRQLPRSWKWPHLCHPGACELPPRPCRYSGVTILWLRHLSENQWTNAHQNEVHWLHTRNRRVSNATRQPVLYTISVQSIQTEK